MPERKPKAKQTKPPRGFIHPLGAVLDTKYGRMRFAKVDHRLVSPEVYERVALLETASIGCIADWLHVTPEELNAMSAVDAPKTEAEPPSEKWWNK